MLFKKRGGVAVDIPLFVGVWGIRWFFEFNAQNSKKPAKMANNHKKILEDVGNLCEYGFIGINLLYLTLKGDIK